MAFNVAEFRSNLIGDGARPNLFQVNLQFPVISGKDIATTSKKISFLARAAQLPGSTVGTVPVYYFGRELKFAGNRTFADWTLQIINDEDFSIRKSLEAWLNAVNSHTGNLRSSSAVSPSSYTTDASVTQFGKTGDALKTYNFVGMFPIDVAPIDLDWSSNDSIEEYSVTFAYQYWESDTTS
jgi:T4-like virus tail tube protein gp19